MGSEAGIVTAAANSSGVLEKILTADAPAPIGPYSQAVRAGEFLFCSGQIPLDPATGQLVTGDVAAQTRRVMTNIAGVLEAAGARFEQVFKTTIYLVDMADFAAVNAVYGEYFSAVAPARSTVAVAALPLGSRVEIEVAAQL
jgi:2-iminobutanoate/2-iminopropanoate deaminase